jgi:hypothetical protein
MIRTHVAVAVAAATAAFAFAGVASAQAVVVAAGPGPREVIVEDEANRPGFSIAANIGFAAGSNDFTGFAAGVRAGYTLPIHLYIGGDVTFYPISGTALISIAPEIGYDIGLRRVPLDIRPYVGLGVALETAGGGAAFEFYPGCEVLYNITREFFVGGDFRIPLIFESGGGTTVIDGIPVATGGGGAFIGINLMGTIGYKF